MKHAFSLIELSIVLVILGLLTGGILSGQSLIRASELRAVTTEYTRYSTAISSFRDKYFALPGDMATATKFWGTSIATGTVDGDGNGIITYPASASITGEAYRAWQHLAYAGLVEGSYTGIAGFVRGTDHDYGTNSPRSKISNVGWSITYLDNSAGTYSNVFKYNYLNWLTVGTSDDNFAENPFLKPEEAWNIDTKLDDGKPGTGSVNGWSDGSCSTATGPADYTSTYKLDNTAIACPLIMRSNSM